MKKVLFTARQLLIGILLLQLINLSLCTESYVDYNWALGNFAQLSQTSNIWPTANEPSVRSGTYYNYSSANTYDPTETIVEWVVEWNKGNQDAFNYTHTINLKGLCKNFTWHVDIQHSLSLPLPTRLPASSAPLGRITADPSPACIEILSPPPEYNGHI
jgi:hypothetical protein